MNPTIDELAGQISENALAVVPHVWPHGGEASIKKVVTPLLTPLYAQLADQQARIAELEKAISCERDLHIMQLAGISTAAIQNTHKSKADRIGRDNPYWTVTYGDVCTAVDREIALRDERDSALARAETAGAACAEMRDALELVADPSWLASRESAVAVDTAVRRALSSTAGQGYVSRERWERLVKAGDALACEFHEKSAKRAAWEAAKK